MSILKDLVDVISFDVTADGISAVTLDGKIFFCPLESN